MTLQRYAKSAAVRSGLCGALLNDDTECHLVAGHLVGDLPHRSYGPYGHGHDRYVEYDDNGTVLDDLAGVGCTQRETAG